VGDDFVAGIVYGKISGVHVTAGGGGLHDNVGWTVYHGETSEENGNSADVRGDFVPVRGVDGAGEKPPFAVGDGVFLGGDGCFAIAEDEFADPEAREICISYCNDNPYYEGRTDGRMFLNFVYVKATGEFMLTHGGVGSTSEEEILEEEIPEEEILEEEVPLGNMTLQVLPMTGDVSVIWMLLSLLSGLALAAASFVDKKRKK